jgi:flagellar motor switch protein FliM
VASILSQAEIDALLSVAADAAPRPVVSAHAASATRYNFRRPDRVSKDQIHSLQFLHERYARNLATSLSAYLRTTIKLSVASIEQLAYSEFLSSLPDPTAYYAVAVAPSNELAALEVNPSVAFAMIDRMLGGGHGKAEVLTRPLTEIEQNVVDSVVKLLLDDLADAWKSVALLSFTMRGRETRPAMLQVAAPNEIVIAVTFDATVGQATGRIHLALPSSVVENAATDFTRSWQKQRRDLTATERAWLSENLCRISVPLVPLIRTQLTAGAVLALEPGEVLALPLAADQALDVYVGGVRKLTERLASEHGRLMVLVEQRCEPRHASGDA